MKAAVPVLLVCAVMTLWAQDFPVTMLGVRVPEEAAALRIAEPVLIKKFGKQTIDDERPFKATLLNGVWMVYGTLCCPYKGRRNCEPGRCNGGVAELELRQSDGKVLSISHQKWLGR